MSTVIATFLRAILRTHHRFDQRHEGVLTLGRYFNRANATKTAFARANKMAPHALIVFAM